MNNKDFITELAQRCGYTQADTQKLMRTLIDKMGETFGEGDNLLVSGFGTFEVKKRLERVAVNPATQPRMLVPPKLVLCFKPVPAVKARLKNGGDTNE